MAIGNIAIIFLTVARRTRVDGEIDHFFGNSIAGRETVPAVFPMLGGYL